MRAFIIDVLYGLHSRIPLCCIWAFTVGGKWGVDIKSRRWKGKYVPCDRCEQENRVKEIHFGDRCCDRYRRFVVQWDVRYPKWFRRRCR